MNIVVGGSAIIEKMETLVHIFQVAGIILGSIVLLIIIAVAFFALWVKRKVNHLIKRFPNKRNIITLIVIPFLNFLLEIFKINADSTIDPSDETKNI